jgi:murein DD-endopeptidase MepM/ murein hydrolase activator NlpD
MLKKKLRWLSAIYLSSQKPLSYMKSILLLLSIVCTMRVASAQTEQLQNRAAADNFEKKYNAGDFEGVFDLFADAMQQSLPIDKTKVFLNQLKTNGGKIVKMEFIKYNNGTFAEYKTTLERALLAINISVDEAGKINGLFVKAYTDETLPKIERNVTKLILPFKDEWTVIWGGDTEALNYHVVSVAQKNAFDIVITDAEGRSFKTDGHTNEDYYDFGRPIFAPCDGEVVLVVDGIKENKPGVLNPVYAFGNTVIIKTQKGEYLVFAHFKQHSIVVRQGQQITQGNQLGQCGNTGNSSEPHLHFHIQNTEDINVATGVKCYFDQIVVNGQLKTDYSPIQKDKIKNP